MGTHRFQQWQADIAVYYATGDRWTRPEAVFLAKRAIRAIEREMKRTASRRVEAARQRWNERHRLRRQLHINPGE